MNHYTIKVQLYKKNGKAGFNTRIEKIFAHTAQKAKRLIKKMYGRSLVFHCETLKIA